MKVCRDCDEEQPLTEFRVVNGHPRPDCRTCEAGRTKRNKIRRGWIPVTKHMERGFNELAQRFCLMPRVE